MAELEQENDSLRNSLGLPPAHRPPLGRGPTGKDKAKPYERGATSSSLNRMSKEEEGSDSPLTNHSSPSSVAQHISSTHIGEGSSNTNSSNLWDSPLSFPQNSGGYSSRDQNNLHTLDSGTPVASTSYTSQADPHFRFGASQSKSRLSGASLFPPPGGSGYHTSATNDRSSTAASTFSRDEPFYSVAGMSSAHGSSGPTSSLRGMSESQHQHHYSSMHSSHHHMDSALGGGGGGGQSPVMSSHPHYAPASPASSSAPSVSLSMAMGLRRSIHDPPQHPSSPYVNAYHSAPYPQRAQPPFPQHTNHYHDPSSPRLSPGQSSGRPGLAGIEQSPVYEPSARRST